MVQKKSLPDMNTHYSARKKIVAAIPCYNTECHIANIIGNTKQYVNAVIVIDDGSTDRTAEMAASYGATVIRHPKNKGYGEALKSCFSAAQCINADVLVIIDGDGQHNPSEIPRILNPILNNEAKIVIGSRLLDTNVKIPNYRKLGIKVINFLWNFGSQTKLTDTQSGFRAYDVSIINDMIFSNKGMSASIETLEKARQKQITIREVCISCSYENNNSSLSLKSVRHGISIALFTLSIRFKRLFNKGKQ